jgi:hypothetical protein
VKRRSMRRPSDMMWGFPLSSLTTDPGREVSRPGRCFRAQPLHVVVLCVSDTTYWGGTHDCNYTGVTQSMVSSAQTRSFFATSPRAREKPRGRVTAVPGEVIRRCEREAIDRRTNAKTQQPGIFRGPVIPEGDGDEPMQAHIDDARMETRRRASPR